jgi:hypothetical protein
VRKVKSGPLQLRVVQFSVLVSDPFRFESG